MKKEDTTSRKSTSLSSTLAVTLTIFLLGLIGTWVLASWHFAQAGDRIYERWAARHENADFRNVKILRVTNYDLEPDEVTVIEPSTGEQVYRVSMLPTKAQRLVEAWVRRSIPKGIQLDGPDQMETWELRGQPVKARWSGGYGDFAVLELEGGKRIHVHRTDLGPDDKARFDRWSSH